MRDRYKPGRPPLPGPNPNSGPRTTELRSQEELAGESPLPYVELRPCGPPLAITEAGPLPLPPEPPPFDRAIALAGLHAAFAQLTDDELEVARVRMLGVAYWEISDELGLREEEVEKLWKRARRKLGTAIYGTGTVSAPGTPAPATPPVTAGDGQP